MEVLDLGAKSAVAVLLIVAGAAKLADLGSFSATVRLFVPHALPPRVRDAGAFGVAVGEVVLGAASLSFPATVWLNLLVLALATAFVVVAVAGFVFHRGRSCRCFGALSQRKFDVLGILRNAGIAALAVIGTFAVQPSAIDISVPAQVMLVISAVLLALAAFTAASAITVSRDSDPWVATK